MREPSDNKQATHELDTSMPRRVVIGVVAIIVVLVAANLFTRLVTDDPTVAAPQHSKGGAPVEPRVTPTAVPVASEPVCDVGAVQEEIGFSGELGDVEPTDSPADLSEQMTLVRGQLVLMPGRAGNGDRIAHARVSDVIGADDFDLTSGLNLRLTGTSGGDLIAMPSSGEVTSISFVAFTWPLSSEPAWAVHPEGLWIGCGWETPALPGLATPDSPGWRDVLDGGVTLDEIWRAAESQPREATLPSPLIEGDGTAVHDITLSTGERLRVSLPEALADGLTGFAEVRPSDGGGVNLTGPSGGLSVGFGFCELSAQLEERMERNSLGSEIAAAGPTVRICRPDEMVSATLLLADTSGETWLDQGFDAFDVRVISSGSSHRTALHAVWPDLANCGNCAPWGPMVFPDRGVVINRTGTTQVSAVSLVDLSEVWRRDVGGFEVALHGGPGAGLFADVLGGAFLRLDPLTGENLWQLERDPDERDADFSRHRGDTWILRSSFAITGDDRAPILRLLDPASGEVRWQAEGRPASAWQWSRPIVMSGVAVVMDVSDHSEDAVRPGATLRGYNLDAGDLVWSTQLNSTTEAFNTDLVAAFDFEFGRAMFAITIEGDLLRVDPRTGDVAWRTPVGQARFNGTRLGPNGDLVLGLTIRGQDVSIDPVLGQIIVG